MRAVFTRQGHIFTTGFTRMSQRELGLWDPVTQLEAWGVCPGDWHHRRGGRRPPSAGHAHLDGAVVCCPLCRAYYPHTPIRPVLLRRLKEPALAPPPGDAESLGAVCGDCMRQRRGHMCERLGVMCPGAGPAAPFNRAAVGKHGALGRAGSLKGLQGIQKRHGRRDRSGHASCAPAEQL